MMTAMNGMDAMSGLGIAMGVGMATFMLALLALIVLATVWLARGLQTSQRHPRPGDTAAGPPRR